MRTLTQLHAEALRNTHRLAEIKDAQVGLDKLEADMKDALGKVLDAHGLSLKALTLTLNLRSGKMPSFGGGAEPDGWFSGSMSVK